MFHADRKDHSYSPLFKYSSPKEFVTCQISIVVNDTREMYDDMGMEDPTTRYVDLEFDPDAVVSYRPDPATEDDPEEGTVFALPNDEYYTEMTVEEFEELIGV